VEPLERRFVPAWPVDLRLTLAIHRRGPADPTMRFSRDGSTWRASRTPEGPATLRLLPDGDAIRAQAWGPGAVWAIEQAPALVGAGDDPGDFADRVAASGHPLLHTLLARYHAIRLGRTERVLEALVPAIIEQKVTGDEARSAFVALVRRHGEPAPGPWVPTGGREPAGEHAPAGTRVPTGGRAPMFVQPAPETLAALPGYAYHPLGLERRRADAIRFAAARANRVEECATMPLPDAYARLRALPLVGPWTAAEVGLRALGDPDAVSLGDFHLGPAICWALAHEERGTDERMLELLAPFAGHRARVIRLVEAAGIHAPRRGPRMAPRSIAGI
jgi:3-methyladenine DNA glycosylase/8-oxoguanine DNA glycosylase